MPRDKVFKHIGLNSYLRDSSFSDGILFPALGCHWTGIERYNLEPAACEWTATGYLLSVLSVSILSMLRQ